MCSGEKSSLFNKWWGEAGEPLTQELHQISSPYTKQSKVDQDLNLKSETFKLCSENPGSTLPDTGRDKSFLTKTSVVQELAQVSIDGTN